MNNYTNDKAGLTVTREQGQTSEMCKKCINCDFIRPMSGYGEVTCSKDTYENNVMYSPFVDRFRDNCQTITAYNIFYYFYIFKMF